MKSRKMLPNGQELKVTIKLKQYKDYGTKLVNIKIQQQAAVQVPSELFKTKTC